MRFVPRIAMGALAGASLLLVMPSAHGLPAAPPPPPSPQCQDAQHHLADDQHHLADDQQHLAQDQAQLAHDQAEPHPDPHKIADDQQHVAQDQQKIAQDQAMIAQDQAQVNQFCGTTTTTTGSTTTTTQPTTTTSTSTTSTTMATTTTSTSTTSTTVVNNQNIIVTYAGNGQNGNSGNNGPSLQATMGHPAGVVLDNAANIFFTDPDNSVVRRVNAAMVITNVAGTGQNGFSGDNGPATAAKLDHPSGIAADAAGNLYVADTNNNRIRKINTSGVIMTVAGSAQNGNAGDNGPATAAQLKQPTGVAVDGAGDIFIADTGNNRIREVLPNGNIVAFAGTGQGGNTGNGGPALNARFNNPRGVAVSGSSVLIADTDNQQVRKVSGGVITAFAGTGQGGFAGDGGQATAAKLNKPSGVSIDPLGNVYITDANNEIIRQVTTSGVISTFAGIPGQHGFSGDNGPATSAKLDLKFDPIDGITTDAANVFFADPNNNRIRRVHKGGPPPRAEAPFDQNVLLAGGAAVVLAAGTIVVVRRNRKRSGSISAL